MTDKTNHQKILLKIQNYLSQRPHSEQELCTKLARGFLPEEVQKALEVARNKKWLLPPEELSLHLKQEMDRKNKGWLLIKAALKKKALPTQGRDEALELKKAKTVLNKKFNTDDTKPLSQSELQKRYRFLQTRGFEDAIIRQIPPFTKAED